MKKLLFVILFGVLALSSVAAPSKAEAFVVDLKLPSAAKIKVATSINNNRLNMIFTNVIFARNIAYELTYNHTGGQEGVVGSFKNNSIWPITKSIFLGTCSSGGTCVAHTNLSNMKLKVTTQYSLFSKTEVTNYTVLP